MENQKNKEIYELQKIVQELRLGKNRITAGNEQKKDMKNLNNDSTMSENITSLKK